MFNHGDATLSRSFGGFLYWFFKHVLGPLVKVIWLKRVAGLTNLPLDGPVVLAANHVSFLDFALLVVVCPRRIYFLVEDFFYHMPVVPFLLRASGQVRVSKERPLAAIEESSRILTRGDVLGVFPEGTRSWTGEPQKAFTGLGRIALDGKAAIVPVAIVGAYEVYPRQRKIPFSRRSARSSSSAPVRYADVVQRLPAGHRPRHGHAAHRGKAGTRLPVPEGLVRVFGRQTRGAVDDSYQTSSGGDPEDSAVRG